MKYLKEKQKRMIVTVLHYHSPLYKYSFHKINETCYIQNLK